MADWTLADAERSNARIRRGEAAPEQETTCAAPQRRTRLVQGAQVVETPLLERTVEDDPDGTLVTERYDGCTLTYITKLDVEE